MSIESIETVESFEARVVERTGISVWAMPEIAQIEGHIVCRRGDTVVVFVGYPCREDEDGTQYWSASAARVVGREALGPCPD